MTREDMIAALESAHAEVADMCQRQWEGKPAINWSIQARHGDSDIAISQAIRAVLAALRATPEGTRETLDALQADIVRRWEARIRPELNYPSSGDILEFMGHVNEAIDAARALTGPPAHLEGTPQTAAPVSLREYAQHKVDCECVRPQMFRGVTLGEGGRCTCGLAAALSAAPPAPQPAHSKCQTCGASKELCLEYKLTALSVGGNRCCSLCNHEAVPPAPTPQDEEMGDDYDFSKGVRGKYYAVSHTAKTIVHAAAPAPTGAPRDATNAEARAAGECVVAERGELLRRLAGVDVAPTGAPADLVSLVLAWQKADPESAERQAYYRALLAWHPAAPALPPDEMPQETVTVTREQLASINLAVGQYLALAEHVNSGGALSIVPDFIAVMAARNAQRIIAALPPVEADTMPTIELGDLVSINEEVDGGSRVYVLNEAVRKAVLAQSIDEIHRFIWRRPAPTGGQ